MQKKIALIVKQAVAATFLLACLSTSAAAQGLRVTEAFLKADDGRMSGACPIKVVFNGYITVDGPGTVAYTFTRSDGATAPIYKIEFQQAGSQSVTTDWTLGDEHTLPVYAGWQAIKILSPNELESSHETGAFSIKCAQGGGVVKPGTPETKGNETLGGTKNIRPNNDPREGQARLGTQAQSEQVRDFAETYKRELPRLLGPQKQRFERDLSELKAFTEKLQPAFAEAQKKAGVDSDAMLTQFRAVAAEHDPAKREQRAAEFQSAYAPWAARLAQESGVDLTARLRELVPVLDLSNAQAKDGTIIVIHDEDARPASTPMPVPDTQERVLRPLFTSSGFLGSESEANRGDGVLRINVMVSGAGSEQRLSFISQSLPVERGVRRVGLSATLDAVTYTLIGLSFVAGYSSSEAIVNLRAMEGTRELCRDRISLGRVVAAVAGSATSGGTRQVILSCEFARRNPDIPTTYDLVAEIEGWAGAGGLAYSSVFMRATLQEFQVDLHRR